jgi:DNA polymerase-4/DNA polymerase V
VHIDGDAFFASCEQSRRPKLQGRPVVTGKERGMAASMSYEAKARGVKRGMRIAEIRKICPDAVILPSDYETYSLLSTRFFAIVRRYTPDVEEYSIDECFADLTGLRRPLRMSYIQIAEQIKKDLDTELGFTFSVGLAPNKPTVCPSVAPRNLLLYQSLPINISYRYALVRRRKDDTSVGAASKGIVA